MPRGVHVSRVLPKLGPDRRRLFEPPAGGPNLFNGKRRIRNSRGLKEEKAQKRVEKDPWDNSWRKIVSKDVSQFVDDMEAQGTKLLPEEKNALLRDPVRYFSRPQNVPESLRQQVYFPNFSIQLRRTERLGPYYAQFYVPLWFSKLDLKAYLKDVYNVYVHHIRSYVVYRARARKQPSNQYTRGELFQPQQRKRMTVQLVEPFVWPVKAEEIDKEEFGTSQKEEQIRKRLEEIKMQNDPFGIALDTEQRKSIAEQAKELLRGRTTWSPTWKSVPQTNQILERIVPEKPLKPISPSPVQSKSPKSWNERWEAAFGKRSVPIEKIPVEVKNPDAVQ